MRCHLNRMGATGSAPLQSPKSAQPGVRAKGVRRPLNGATSAVRKAGLVARHNLESSEAHQLDVSGPLLLGVAELLVPVERTSLGRQVE